MPRRQTTHLPLAACLAGVALCLLCTPLWATVTISPSAPHVPPSTAVTDAIVQSQLSLIDALVAKGLLTAEDGAELKEELVKKTAPEETAPAPAAAPKYPNLSIRTQLATRFSQSQTDEGKFQPSWGNTDDVSGGDGFGLNHFRLEFDGAVNDNTAWHGLLLVYEGMTGPSLGNGFLIYKGLRDVVLAAGSFYPPMGYELIQEESDFLVTDPSALSNILMPIGGYGVRLFGKRPLPGGITWEASLLNGKGKFSNNVNHSFETTVRLAKQVTPALNVGLEGSYNPNVNYNAYSQWLAGNDDPYGLLAAYAAEKVTETTYDANLQYHKGRSTLWAEHAWKTMDTDFSDTPDVKANGYYINYLHGVGAGDDPERVEFVLGYQHFDPNRDITDVFDLHSYILGLNFHLENSKRYCTDPNRCNSDNLLRLNYIWNREGADQVKNNKFVVQWQRYF